MNVPTFSDFTPFTINVIESSINILNYICFICSTKPSECKFILFVEASTQTNDLIRTDISHFTLKEPYVGVVWEYKT